VGTWKDEEPAFGFPPIDFSERAHTQKWKMIQRKLNPLKETLTKQKKNEDAFLHIWRSFTYGKRLKRNLKTQAEIEAERRQEEQRKRVENEKRLLYVLLNKKSKSISGSVERNEYKVENDVTGEEGKDKIDFKAVRFRSIPNFTYFRTDQDFMVERQFLEDQV